VTGLGSLLVVTKRGYTGTFTWTDWQSWTANVVLRPVLFLVVFGVIHDELTLGSTIDVIVALCAYDVVVAMLMGVNHSVRNDIVDGTFTTALVTPVPAMLIWVSRAVAHLPNAVATGVVAVGFSAVAFDLDLGRVDLAVVAVFGAVLASATGMAMLAAVLTAEVHEWTGVVGLASGLVLTLSGAVIPRAVLPGPLHALSAGVPLAHANDALRRSLGTQPGNPWPDVLGELAVAAAVIALALLAFGWWLRRARRLGSLVVEGT
jgi:ABC-type multidrug transport system permease subunit